MQLSLVDSLRCPAHQEESVLVLSVESWAGSRVAQGVLGCPACKARYPIRGGTVHFSSTGNVGRGPAAEDADFMRVTAQLGLSDAGGVILLTGKYAAIHASLTDLVEVTCLLVDGDLAASALAVNFVLDDRLPLVDRALRGAAIDAARASLLPEVTRCMRPGGRIVAPVAAPIPFGVRPIARDDREWVGEVDMFSSVQLRRSDPTSTP